MGQLFACIHGPKFVLSWYIGNNRQALYKQLCEAIHQMEVGEVLTSVRDEYCEDFYKYYLHDLVRTIHKSQNIEPKQVETEYSVSLTCARSMQFCINTVIHTEIFNGCYIYSSLKLLLMK